MDNNEENNEAVITVRMSSTEPSSLIHSKCRIIFGSNPLVFGGSGTINVIFSGLNLLLNHCNFVVCILQTC